MQIQLIIRYSVLVLTLAGAVTGYSAEMLNDVIALVGDKAVTQLDLDEEIARIKKDKSLRRDQRDLKSQALDNLIDHCMVERVLEEEFIKVSDSQIDAYIEKEMEASGISSQAEFAKILRAQRGLSLEQYRDMLLERMKLQNVMQLRVPVEAPTEAQMERWYKVNRSKLGKKFKIRVIRMKYNANDLQDELRVNKKMKEARAVAVNDFAKAAQQYSDHPTGNSGGYLGWQMPHELRNTEGEEVAQVLFQVKPGSVSPVFVSNGAYYLVKVERSMTPTLEDIRELARNYVYAENQKAAYSLWLREERKRTAIQIFMKGYQKP